jgi:hypothetical protein
LLCQGAEHDKFEVSAAEHNVAFLVEVHLQRFLPCVQCSFFDQRCNLFRPGEVDRVAGACDFDRMAFGACRIPAFKVGVDGPVFCATKTQLGLLRHAAVVMTALKLSAKFGTCDRAMNAACSADKSAAKYS